MPLRCGHGQILSPRYPLYDTTTAQNLGFVVSGRYWRALLDIAPLAQHMVKSCPNVHIHLARVSVLMLVLLVPFPSACAHELRPAKISTDDAIRLAQPYLDRTFELRSENRPEDMQSDRPPRDIVTPKGRWYYVVRDNYPAVKENFYLDHAVKVHMDTGEIIEPE
jgi:hypothetical protein